MKIKIYAGLSVEAKDIEEILPGAEVAGPVQRGDILKDVAEGYNVVALIDGKFDQNLAVAPSEVMDALRAGVRVYGSSSMGALRAAETAAYGTIGYGRVFEYIKNSENFRDDYLGQLFINKDIQWKSPAYIDFYFSAQNLVQIKKISKALAGRICALYEEIFYAQRCEDALLDSIRKQKKNAAELLKAAQLIFSENDSQKSKDAKGLLSLIKSDLEKIKSLNSEFEAQAAASHDPLKFYPVDLYL